jgi:hypothetical protein
MDFIERRLPDGYGFILSKNENLYSCPVLDQMRWFRGCQKWPVALIVGQSGDHRIWFFGWDMSNSSAGEYEDSDALWCVAYGKVTLNVHITSPDREIYSDSLYGEVMKHFTDARDQRYTFEPIEEALLKARQARFEHGEKPNVSIVNPQM